jgi:predicted nucleotide-binding protein (sugar kinase/HSP70/actin superfamily)
VTVGVVAHHYLLGDPLLNNRIVHWLNDSGARVIGSSILSEEEIESEAGRFPPLSWSYEKELLCAASIFLEREDVDGVVYMTSFGCGPDSVIMEMVRRELRSARSCPMLELVLDEHSAEAGVRTRAEAFVDGLRHQRSRTALARSAV